MTESCSKFVTARRSDALPCIVGGIRSGIELPIRLRVCGEGHGNMTLLVSYQALVMRNARMDLSRTVVHVQNFVNRSLAHVTAAELLPQQGNALPCTENQGDVAAWARERCSRHIDWDNERAHAPRAFTQQRPSPAFYRWVA